VRVNLLYNGQLLLPAFPAHTLEKTTAVKVYIPDLLAAVAPAAATAGVKART
jgi:hypothetical protein